MSWGTNFKTKLLLGLKLKGFGLPANSTAKNGYVWFVVTMEIAALFPFGKVCA